MKTIFHFLKSLAANNNREWFQANRQLYDQAREEFEAVAEKMIAEIGAFDPDVAGIPVKDTLYRIYRDVRFSNDKSPYKTHLGCYINPKGKKSQHGGYYLHIEPGGCGVAGGAYCLEGPVLKAVRRSIVDRIDEYRSIVENPEFKALFPVIGMERLKTLPAGFDRSFPYPDYIRPKDYSTWHSLPDSFFLKKGWEKEAAKEFRILKPFLDFINDTVDDYI